MSRVCLHTEFPLIFLVYFLLLILPGGSASAQDINIDCSAAFDDNVFDSYLPVFDRIVQLQADLSHGLDYDKSSVNLEYNASALLFRDIPGRNYHVHFIILSGTYRFEEDNTGDDESDSTGESGEDSTSGPAPVPAVERSVFSDSLCHFLETVIVGVGQFDRNEYSVYDNTKASGSIAFRQPLGLKASVRPLYAISYNNYANLSGLGNLQNMFGVRFGTDILPGGFISVTPSYAIKSYPESAQFVLSYPADTTIVVQTHGKPIITKGQIMRQRKIDLNSPTVRQVSVSATWKQRISPMTSFTSTYSYLGKPTATARVIPELGLGAVEAHVGLNVGGDDIFDDPFSYSGSLYQVEVNQNLPLSFQLIFSGEYAMKDYTYNATDASDSVLAEKRSDRRTTIDLTLSRRFELGKGRDLTPRIEFHHTGNVSNAAYYEFTKVSIVAGVGFSF